MSHIVDQVSLGAIVQVRDRLLEQQAQGRKVLRLESGDPSFDIPPHVREAMEKALRDGQTHYTASTGIPQLRNAILRKVIEENKLSVPGADNIIVTNGAMNGLYILFRGMLEAGDEVIIPDPMWTEIAENIRLGGGVPIPVRLDADRGYRYDPAKIESAITPKTRAIFVNTPQNPTGAIVEITDLIAVAEIAAKHNLTIISDEAYEHVIFDDKQHISIGSLDAAKDRTVSVHSLSKTYAMSGLRLGYLVITDPILLDRAKKLVRCTINGVNSVTQWGAAAAINGPQEATNQMQNVYQQRRDILFEAASKSLYLKPFKPGGAFYLWCQIAPDWIGYEGNKDDWSMTRYLIDKAGIGSAPGTAFGAAGEAHIRFAFSCPTEQVEEAAKLLPDVLKAA